MEACQRRAKDIASGAYFVGVGGLKDNNYRKSNQSCTHYV